MLTVAALMLGGLLTVTPCVVHSQTGLSFAGRLPGLRCSGPRVLDEERGEVSVAYKADAPGRRFTVTVFVYRRLPPLSAPDEPLEHHLAAVREEVARRYSSLECQAWQAAARPGMRWLQCAGRSEELGPEGMVTFIGLEEVGACWLKIRATDRAGDASTTERDLQAVVSGVEQLP